MTKVIFRINHDGSLMTLSGSGIEECLDLRTFGHISATRAGIINFDEASQTWYWSYADGEKGGWGFQTRKEAVADEIETLLKTL